MEELLEDKSAKVSAPLSKAPVAGRNRPRAGAVIHIQLALVIGLLLLWQYAVDQKWVSAFLVGSPAGIFEQFVARIRSGALWEDTWVTLIEALAGFVIGNLVGAVAGLGLWYSVFLTRIVAPFIVALNSVPKIAFAPIIILWVGTGIASKIALAVFTTSIIALIATYQAARDVDSDLQSLMWALGATKRQVFFKVVVPATLPAIIAAFRITLGFSLTGAIVGEFITSSHGLGYMIATASGLYDLNTVWVGLFMLMIVGFLLYHTVDLLERYLLPWKQAASEKSPVA
jgi:NitT/TauT family transport system permease protein